MIEALRDNEVIRRAGGRFRLAAIIQRRWAQLMEGARPMVERQGRSNLELVVEEILAGKLECFEDTTPRDDGV